MDALIREFAAGLAEAARGDIEAAIDRALKKAGTGRANRALASLRERALGSLERIADGRDGRLPVAVLDEVHAGIHAALHPEAEGGLALAKRASGPGHQEAAGLLEMTREQKVAAFIELADELKALVAQWRPLFRKLEAEDRLDRLHRGLARDLAELARVGDLTSARARMDKAPGQIVATYDDVKLDRAFAAPQEKAAGPMIPGWHRM